MGGVESLSLMGFRLVGRFSIFFMNLILMLLCVGALIIYFNVFGGICASLVQGIFNAESDILTTKYLYVILLGVLNIVPILMKTIKELKIVSVILFGSLIAFLLTLLILAIAQGTDKNPDTNLSHYWAFKFDK